ncbi:hypothetical protein [Paraburkholderia sp. RL17-337-BIB-A]|uniref:hypothetical protein n=1 Tax=Paraburkholderia sp. RL17-337-BIB-A TaxID=3031636 RepID=UPI0038B6F706
MPPRTGATLIDQYQFKERPKSQIKERPKSQIKERPKSQIKERPKKPDQGKAKKANSRGKSNTACKQTIRAERATNPINPHCRRQKKPPLPQALAPIEKATQNQLNRSNARSARLALQTDIPHKTKPHQAPNRAKRPLAAPQHIQKASLRN